MARGKILTYVVCAFAVVAAACTRQDTAVPDEFNRRAYMFRYVDVDSSLYYADRAYEASLDYPDGRVEAISHRAFVQYQRMCFTKAMEELDRVYALTGNQVELLCADVLRMKISQRTGRLRTFYRAWHSAERRLRRIDEEAHLLSAHHQGRLLYARTEMHIIASTYYFYARQDSASWAEIGKVEPYMQLPRDTAQWTGYMYMLGSGGMMAGDSATVILKEFDYLTHVLTIARRRNDRYFQANSLQALAVMLENPGVRERIRLQRGGGLDFVVGRYAASAAMHGEDSVPLALANSALALFRRYGDRFQTANVLRTKAELLFRQGRYREALVPLHEALGIVDGQHCAESECVPYWEAAIYERLSLTYSALGDARKAMEYRGMYRSFWEVMRQDREVGERAEELRLYNKRLYVSLSVIAALLAGVVAAFWVLLRRLRRIGRQQEREAEEHLQMLRDETCAREMELAREKLANIERRAKVSLAESVVPYINRMLRTRDMEYIGELSAEILRINDILTEWIQVCPGKVAMNITTFPLQPLLDTIARNRSTYLRQGLSLEVPVTDVCVKADRALTLFMINTLCDNARKFTPPGGRVSIVVEADDSVVDISVADTGCGLSREDVDKINNSKVFRIAPSPSAGGGAACSADAGGGAGFGFGLMNCKGIIGQMKKLSSRFRCCDFGVESTEGQGSRFHFRLPRVLAVLVFIPLPLVAAAHAKDYDAARRYCDMMQAGNAAARPRAALRCGERALELVPDDSLALMMRIEDGMAVASQMLCRWDDYACHNSRWLSLHRRLTADPGLPSYARRLHLLKSESDWAVSFTLMFLLCSAFFLALLVRRSRRRRGEMLHQEDLLLQQRETLNRVQFELERVHIQNRILDNCLSTIKHETMYYPARIRQMALKADTEAGDMFQLTGYYSEIYTILLAQAQSQTASRLAMDEGILRELKRRIMASISNVPVAVTVADEGSVLRIRIKAAGAEVPGNLFTAEAGNQDAFVAREIVRMHDAACGYPGLRLYVENNEIIMTLWKNSRLLSSRTFSWS